MILTTESYRICIQEFVERQTLKEASMIRPLHCRVG